MKKIIIFEVTPTSMLPYYIIIPSTSAFICSIAGIVFWRHLLPSLRILAIEALISGGVDITCYLHFHAFNGAIHNLFCFGDFFLLLSGTYSLLPDNVRIRLYTICGSIFILCWCYFIFFYQKSIMLFANDAVIVSSLLLFINYLVTLYVCETQTSLINTLSLRLLCFSIIIYICGTFASFIAINRYLTHHTMPEWIGDINTCMDTIRYTLLGFAFVTFRRQYFRNKTAANG